MVGVSLIHEIFIKGMNAVIDYVMTNMDNVVDLLNIICIVRQQDLIIQDIEMVYLIIDLKRICLSIQQMDENV